MWTLVQVTLIDAVGTYTGNPQKIMFVLASARQSSIIFNIIKDIDPKAFISQSRVIGVYGEGFRALKGKSKAKWYIVILGFQREEFTKG